MFLAQVNQTRSRQWLIINYHYTHVDLTKRRRAQTRAAAN